jgi:hypothetical protein
MKKYNHFKIKSQDFEQLLEFFGALIRQGKESDQNSNFCIFEPKNQIFSRICNFQIRKFLPETNI